MWVMSAQACNCSSHARILEKVQRSRILISLCPRQCMLNVCERTLLQDREAHFFSFSLAAGAKC